jgi:DNA invertase Pin-like site-specific DNA recombinase
MIVGYARVSTDGQTLDVQVSALTVVGANKIFKEKNRGLASIVARVRGDREEGGRFGHP